MDISALLFDLVKSDPAMYHNYLKILYANPEYAAKTTVIYEEWVEKSALLKGMDDAPFNQASWIGTPENRMAHLTLQELLPEIGSTPLSGVKTVKAGLSSPVSRERRLACHVLFDWRKALGKSLSEFSPELWDHVKAVADIEINAELKDNYRKLLQET
jgi:hypothetical protein